MTETCSHPDGCTRPATLRGWCKIHYERIRRTGDPGPAGIQSRAKPTSIARFLSMTAPGPNGCVLWQGCLAGKGYGHFEGTTAHRWIYEYHHGVKLGRLEFVLHSCDNPPCVNLEHLRKGTPRENTLEMYAKGRSAWQRKRAQA